MPLNALFHVAIKTADLDATRRFYTEVLGMTIDPSRPNMDFPGLWLKCPVPGGIAIFHVYAGYAAQEADGNVTSGTGVIDHVSVSAIGYRELRERFRAHELAWREQILPTVGLWQLFVHDPSGVLLELTFSAAAEGGEDPSFPPERQYRATERFLEPSRYDQFRG